MPKIVGLDVGCGYAIACLLDYFPVNIQQHFKQLQKNRQFIKLKTDPRSGCLRHRAGVEKLLLLSPDAIVLEPSGFWYSAFWMRVAKTYNIDVCWIGHSDLSHTRGSYGFANKRDDEDSLCLVATYFDDRFIDVHGLKRYLSHYRHLEIEQLRSGEAWHCVVRRSLTLRDRFSWPRNNWLSSGQGWWLRSSKG